MIPVVPAANIHAKHNAGRIFGTSGNVAAILQQNGSMNSIAMAPLVPFLVPVVPKQAAKSIVFGTRTMIWYQWYQ